MSTENLKLRFNFSNTLIGAVLATAVVTVTMLISGTDIVKALGVMLVGGDATQNAQYAAGGFMHLFIGVSYGILYALLFAPIREWNKLIKGVVFGVFITALALSFMPIMASLLAGNSVSAANPCNAQIHNVCHMVAQNSCNPCGSNASNPCSTQGMKSSNPCTTNIANPCNGKMINACNPCADKVRNPCNPCGLKTSNPCSTSTQGIISSNPCMNPCLANSENPCDMKASKSLGENPCNHRVVKMSKPSQQHSSVSTNPCAAANPCGGSGGSGNPYASLTSLINHLFFGLTLAFFIRKPE